MRGSFLRVRFFRRKWTGTPRGTPPVSKLLALRRWRTRPLAKLAAVSMTRWAHGAAKKRSPPRPRDLELRSARRPPQVRIRRAIPVHLRKSSRNRIKGEPARPGRVRSKVLQMTFFVATTALSPSSSALVGMSYDRRMAVRNGHWDMCGVSSSSTTGLHRRARIRAAVWGTDACSRERTRRGWWLDLTSSRRRS